MAAKSSILVFYLELTNKRKMFYWANYVWLAVVLAAGIGLTVHQVRRLGDPVYRLNSLFNTVYS